MNPVIITVTGCLVTGLSLLLPQSEFGPIALIGSR